MAKDLNKLRAQKPLWIAVNEPVSGSSDPLNQDAYVQPDGTIVSNVEGVNNRNPAHLWGLLKLFADIFEVGHNVDGTHNLSNDDIAGDAEISEEKLSLSFEGRPRPSGGSYNTIADITDEIDLISNRVNQTTYSVQINQTGLFDKRFDKETVAFFKEYGLGLKFRVNPKRSFYQASDPLNQEFLLWDNNSYMIFAGRKIVLARGIIDSGNVEKYPIAISIPEASKISINPSNYIILMDIFLRELVNEDDQIYMFGNLDSSSENASWDNIQKYGSQGIHNIIAISDKFYQLSYKIHIQVVDLLPYFDDPMKDPSLRTHDNKEIVFTGLLPNLFASDDFSEYVIPIGIISQPNLGVYDEHINPLGRALKRAGATINNVHDCFDYRNIAYYDSDGNECPDYDSANYDADLDVYILGTTTFFRSGTPQSQMAYDNDFVTSIREDRYFSLIPFDQYEYKDFRNLLVKYISGNVKTLPVPFLYGNITNIRKSSCFGDGQIVSFARSEVEAFSSDTINGVFIDIDNARRPAFTDGVRYNWSDREVNQRTLFKFKEGDDDSEDPSVLCTYEPATQTVTLNTTSLSGECVISSETPPKLFWENGDEVQIEGDWSGLGTTSAYVRLDSTDCSNHSGQWVYGICVLQYPKGGGTPFIFHKVEYFKDAFGREFSVVYDIETNDLIAQYPIKLTADGTSNSFRIPSDVTIPENIVGYYISILKAHDSTDEGKVFEIIAYNPSTRRASIDGALSGSFQVDDIICLCKMKPDETLVCVSPFSRGIRGAYKRVLISAPGSSVLTKKVIVHHSHGSLYGLVISDLNDVNYVDCIIYDTDLFKLDNSPFYLKFSNDLYLLHQHFPVPQNGKAIFKDFGSLFRTTVGSANSEYGCYCATLPGTTFPMYDKGVNFIGRSNKEKDKISVILRGDQIPIYNGIIPYHNLVMDLNNGYIEGDYDKFRFSLRFGFEADQNHPFTDFYMYVAPIEIDNRLFFFVFTRNGGTLDIDSGTLDSNCSLVNLSYYALPC